MSEKDNIKQFKKSKDVNSEFNKKRANHQMNKLMWILAAITAAVVLVAGVILLVRVFVRNRQYNALNIVESTDFFISTGSEVKRFGEYFIVYNYDGIKCVNYKGEQVWNEAFMMQKPLVDIGKDVVAVADYNGSTIYLMNNKSVLGKIDTGMPVRKFKASPAGYVMAVLDNTTNTPIYIYDSTGKEMVYFNTTMKVYGYPMEIAISDNGILGAVSYINVDKGSFYTNLGFYNFGEVGMNYQDNLMSSYTYTNALVPEVKFSGNDKAVAIADNKLAFFSGDQMPSSSAEIIIDEKIQSVFSDENYVAVVFLNDNSEHKYKADIYNYGGDKKDTIFFDVDYDEIFFDNDRVIVYNNEEIYIHNIGGSDKFLGNFDETILTILPTGSSKRFYIVTPDRIETVELVRE